MSNLKKYSINPPPRPITPNSNKDIEHQFTELYKTIYPLWEAVTKPGVTPSSGNEIVDLTEVGNAGVSDSILLQYLVNPNTFSQSIKIEGFGIFAANTNNKRIRLYAGTSVILDTGVTPINGNSWVIESEIFRVSINSQKSNSTIISSDKLSDLTFSKDLSEDLSTSLLIKFVANGQSNNDVIQKGLIIKLI